MSEAMIIAILNAVAKVGFEAVSTFLRNRGATIDDAIAALDAAAIVSMADYKRRDLERRELAAHQTTRGTDET